MQTTEKQIRPFHIEEGDAYRTHIADLIMDYVTDRGALLNNPEAYRRVMNVTGKTLGTVKNWLSYKTNSPDIVSLALIVNHWNIPSSAIFPPNLSQLLGSFVEDDLHALRTPTALLADFTFVPLYGSVEPTVMDKALSRYTDRPKTTLLVRQNGGEMNDEIRAGELMLVDAGNEEITSSGIYMLRHGGEGQQSSVIVRYVDRLLGEPSVRIRQGSGSLSTTAETLPLRNGLIEGVTVLARVLGVLRQL